MNVVEFLKDEYPWIYRDVAENYSDKEINEMNRRELLEAYLRYQGIVNYTDTIIPVFEALFRNDITKQYYCDLAECDFDCKLDGSFE